MKTKKIFLKDGDNFIRVSSDSGYPSPVDNILSASSFGLDEALEYQSHFNNLTVVEVELSVTEKVIRNAKKKINLVITQYSNGALPIEGMKNNFSNLTKSFIQSSVHRLSTYIEADETISLENLLKRIDRNKLFDREKADAYDFLKTILEIENV